MSADPMWNAGPNHASLVLLPATPVARTQRILTVEFRSLDGRSWKAIGGGDTQDEAIAWARDSCPRGTTWVPVGWEDRYGD